RAKVQQVDENGHPLTCLYQNQPTITSPPLSGVCSGQDAKGKAFDSHFRNRLFSIFDYIPRTAKTCYEGRPGGCTADLVHNFYQSQFQLNGGRMNRFAVANSSAGLTLGYYQTRKLPIYKYLHRPGHPRYAIADRFFQAAFGGSFLNHMWLVSARTPVWPHADNSGGDHDLHSAIDANGMPRANPESPPLQSPPGRRVGGRHPTAPGA